MPHPAAPPAVLHAFGLAPAPIRPAASGLINRTWHVRSLDGRPLVLQRVNPIFPPAINRDIDALTAHLAAKGLATPRLVPAADGALWVEHDGGVWRVLTHVDGVTYDAAETPRRAREAGAVLGRFHAAVRDFDYTPSNARLGVHDTARHLALLRAALEAGAPAAELEAARPLADEVFALAARLPPLPKTPDRLVHGDPKISNIVFDPATGRGVCLIDLDTLARMPVTLELGDALRSWCNPAAEDAPEARFDDALFAAALEGYAVAAPGLLEPAEARAIPAATLTIAVELAARFCRDALEDRYFAYDRDRYPSRTAHNRARARGQLALARGIAAALPALDEAVARIFGLPAGAS
ncbi:MAG TPA: phosphotransferase [Gammaproteobacteria bacterium]